MESMGRKRPRPRRSFTPEFKTEIVELCQRGDRSAGPGREGLRPDRDRGPRTGQAGRTGRRDPGPDGGVTSAGQGELAQLRAENRRRREDVDILKQATAFFAKQTR